MYIEYMNENAVSYVLLSYNDTLYGKGRKIWSTVVSHLL